MTSCKCGTDNRPSGLGDPGGARSDRTAKRDVDPERTPLAGKEFFRVDAAPEQPPCQVDSPCEARVILTALGDYHVNEKFPSKLVADATPGVTIGTSTFSPDGKTGTLALPFRASKPGTATIAGTFRLSVCNDENCMTESPKIAFDVAVR